MLTVDGARRSCFPGLGDAFFFGHHPKIVEVVIIEPIHFDILEAKKWYFLLVFNGFVIKLLPISGYYRETTGFATLLRIRQNAAGCMEKRRRRLIRGDWQAGVS
jgi:hypothetical protein